MEIPTIELGIAGWRVPLHAHIAAFWETDEDLAEALGFIEAGLRDTDHCALLGDPQDIERMLGILTRRGLDPEGLRARRRLSILERLPTSPEMLKEISSIFEGAISDGAPRIRLAGIVGWGRQAGPPDAELFSLEARLTGVAEKYPCVILCLHRVNATTGPLLRHGVLGTHPQTLVEKNLLGNPLFVPFERFEGRLSAVAAELSKQQGEREAFHRETELLRAILDNIPVMISFYDAAGRLLFVNREWEQVLGWSLGEARSTDILAAAYPDPERRGEAIDFMLQAGGVWKDFQTRTRDGRLIDTSWLRRALSDDTRIGFGLDMTERKRAEGSSRESRELLRLVLETLPVGVVVTNQAGDIVLVNSASRRIWGGEILSGPDRWVRSKGTWHGSGKKIAPEEWASVRALRDGQTSLNELIDIDTYDGKHKTMQNSAAPIRNTEGTIVGAVIVNDDVTERVHAEEGLRRSEQELRSLSERLRDVREEEWARISREIHDEIGQALTALQMDVAWIGKKFRPSSAPNPEYLAGKLRSMAELIDQTIAAVQRIATELRPSVLDHLGLEAAIEWYVREFEERTGIACRFDSHAGATPVDSERATATFRILQEALTNVARHSGATRVEIRLTADQDRLRLEIEDNGQGLPQDQLEEVKTLGLLGMRERAQSLGGNVSVARASPSGTVIRLTIPQ